MESGSQGQELKLRVSAALQGADNVLQGTNSQRNNESSGFGLGKSWEGSTDISEGFGMTKSRGKGNKEGICLLCLHLCGTPQRTGAFPGFGKSHVSASAWEHSQTAQLCRDGLQGSSSDCFLMAEIRSHTMAG